MCVIGAWMTLPPQNILIGHVCKERAWSACFELSFDMLNYRSESGFESWEREFQRCVSRLHLLSIFPPSSPVSLPRWWVLDLVWIWFLMDPSRAFVWYAPRCKWTCFGFEGSHRVSILNFVFPVFRTAMRSWRPDFSKKKARNAKSAYVHLEGLAKSFSLMCSPRQSGRSWTRGLMSCIPKVFFLPHMGNLFWPWDPIILFEMINLRVSMNVTCEVFVKGFRLIFCHWKRTQFGFKYSHRVTLNNFFNCPSGRQFWAGGPFFSTIWSRLSQM